MKLFMASAAKERPLNSDSAGAAQQVPVSAFLTTQSFMNFSAITGGITASWHALHALDPWFGSKWVPFTLAILWLVVSLVNQGRANKLRLGDWFQAGFLGFLNALVLFGATVGIVPVTPSNG